LYPAQLLGLKDLGKIEKGMKASFIELDENFNIIN